MTLFDQASEQVAAGLAHTAYALEPSTLHSMAVDHGRLMDGQWSPLEPESSRRRIYWQGTVNPTTQTLPTRFIGEDGSGKAAFAWQVSFENSPELLLRLLQLLDAALPAAPTATMHHQMQSQFPILFNSLQVYNACQQQYRQLVSRSVASSLTSVSMLKMRVEMTIEVVAIASPRCQGCDLKPLLEVAWAATTSQSLLTRVLKLAPASGTLVLCISGALLAQLDA